MFSQTVFKIDGIIGIVSNVCVCESVQTFDNSCVIKYTKWPNPCPVLTSYLSCEADIE